MKKFLFILAVGLTPLGALAQPPEELPPPPPESVPLEIAPSTPPPSTLPSAAPKQARIPAPVAEPVPLPSKEDKSLKGLSISPGIGIYPIGFDNVDISGVIEGSRWFFGLRPNVSLAKAFKSPLDNLLDFTIDYEMLWREYFNKATTARDFDQTLSGSLNIPFTDRFSVATGALMEYFFKSGADTEGDNIFFLQTDPTLVVKANDVFTFKLGYMMRVLYVLNAHLNNDTIDSWSDPPSDPGDVGGSLLTPSTAYPSWVQTPYGLYPSTSTTTAAPAETMWVNENRALLGMSATPIKGTKLGLNYFYVFAGISNKDENQHTAHIFTPSISQALPWKGGNISLSEEMRFRSFTFATTSDGSTKLVNRFRTTLAVSQEITSYLSFEGWFRMDLTDDNTKDKVEHQQKGYMGVNFSF